MLQIGSVDYEMMGAVDYCVHVGLKSPIDKQFFLGMCLPPFLAEGERNRGNFIH